MSTALMEAPTPLFAAGPRRTLENLLEDSLRTALRDGHTDCPICPGTMHTDGPQATCNACGSTLS